MKENYPLAWRTCPDIAPQEPIKMPQSFTSRLPRVLIFVHYANGLSKPNTYVKIRIFSFSKKIRF